MEKDWMMVYSTADKMRAQYVKELLEKNNILVVQFNRMQNPYAEGVLMGDLELFVHWQQAEEALEIIYNLPE